MGSEPPPPYRTLLPLKCPSETPVKRPMICAAKARRYRPSIQEA